MTSYLRRKRSAEREKNISNDEGVLTWVRSLLLAVVVALLVRFFVFELVRVEGTSMINTLQNNQRVFTWKLSYLFNPPKPGDIIICEFPNSQDRYVKRVVAVEGDVVSIQNGLLHVNDVPYQEDYLAEPMIGTFAPTLVPQGCVFVMGDNRNLSHDSRSVGAIAFDQIMGKAVFVSYPFADFKVVTHQHPEAVEQ